MQVDKPQIPNICLQQGIRQNMGMGSFKQPEIVLFPIGKGQANDLSILKVYQHLCFQGMTARQKIFCKGSQAVVEGKEQMKSVPRRGHSLL